MFIFLTVRNAELDTNQRIVSRKWTGTSSWLLGRKIGPMFVLFWSWSSQHCRISAISLFSYFFQCPRSQCSIWQLCMPGANADKVRVSFTVSFILRSSLLIPPPLCFFSYLSPPLSFPHLNFSVLSHFFVVALYCDWIFPPTSLQFHLTGTLSNPEVLLWILSHSKF